MIRRVPSKQRNNRIAREIDRSALTRLALLFISGLIIAGGFLYAGRQHFIALRYGYETESLRKVREQLGEEQRRFLLEREAALSPGRVERAARELGLQPMQPAQIDRLGRSSITAEKPIDSGTLPRAQKRETRNSLARPVRVERSNKPI